MTIINNKIIKINFSNKFNKVSPQMGKIIININKENKTIKQTKTTFIYSLKLRILTNNLTIT